MKKLGVLFATVIMLMLFVVSANALEPTGQCGDNVYWNFNESTGELVISGSGDMWNDISVFRDNNGIKKVTIKKGVTSVSDEAFDRCFYLESVDLADSVTSIGYGAFTNCDELNSIYIPKSVTEIKTNAFSWSDSLSSIIVDNDNLFFASDANGVLFDKDFKTLIRYPIGNKQTSYTIPKGVVNIARIAFLGCYELISVAIPDTVVTIGEDAFNGCYKLKSIIIPKNVAEIDSCAFAYCNSLESIIVDQNNKYFSSDDRGALFNKNKTKLIQYPCGNKKEVYSIPAGVTDICASAVAGCHNLKSIIIPEGVVEIHRYAFNNCLNLEEISIPNTVNSIGYYAIGACDKLKNVNIPDSVKTIGEWAFNANYSLTDIFIPKSVTYIGNGAFRACENLTNITVDENNISYSSDEFGVLYNKEKTILMQCPAGNDNPIYNIPNGVTNIDANAFYGCKNIENVIIPGSVTNIGNYAFEYCRSLTSVVIPDNITTIGFCAFYSCDNLKHVCFKGSEEQWNNIKISEYNSDVTHPEYLHFNFNPEIGITENITDATCIADGTKTISCSCGYKYTYKLKSALGHNLGEYITTKESTCTEKGEKRAYCSRCDYYETKKIALKKHTNTNDDEYCDVCELYLPSLDCLCVCHAKTIGAFMYKLFAVLDKLFGTNLLEKVFDISEYCDCGLKH